MQLITDTSVAVELGGQYARGMTVVDWQERTGQPVNARILLRYDRARFEAMVRRAVGAA